jgi:predicted transcriptional regulator of viral defense system
MNFLDFRQKIEQFPVFSTGDLKLILRSDFNRAFLNNLKNWEKKGYLVKLRKSLFVPAYLKYAVDPMFLASRMYESSYVSLETALGYYGIIPEAVFTITSISTQKTKEFINDFGKFTFQKIKKEAFGGYETIFQKEFSISYNLALPEKALVDFFYLNRNILDGSRKQFEGYRFSEEFRYNKKRLIKFSDYFKNKKVSFLTNNFIKFYVAG